MKRLIISIGVLGALVAILLLTERYFSVSQLNFSPSFDYSKVPTSFIGRTYSRSEVSAHSSPRDCWMIIAQRVYNVTREIPRHQGGKIITLGCGKDATALFYMRPSLGDPHSERATAELYDFYIGELKQ
jgi:cytochrome b involved in lipid metabolism